MWGLDDKTPYGADRAWIRDKTGAHQWLVAVKATFDVGEQGRLRLADEQPPPPREAQYRGDPATTSLRLDSELLAAKPATDVILDAYAHPHEASLEPQSRFPWASVRCTRRCWCMVHASTSPTSLTGLRFSYPVDHG